MAVEQGLMEVMGTCWNMKEEGVVLPGIQEAHGFFRMRQSLPAGIGALRQSIQHGNLAQLTA
jgi:hypothetical protein